jgi:hypothetical protein
MFKISINPCDPDKSAVFQNTTVFQAVRTMAKQFISTFPNPFFSLNRYPPKVLRFDSSLLQTVEVNPDVKSFRKVAFMSTFGFLLSFVFIFGAVFLLLFPNYLFD